jgi:hypothetical protein
MSAHRTKQQLAGQLHLLGGCLRERQTDRCAVIPGTFAGLPPPDGRCEMFLWEVPQRRATCASDIILKRLVEIGA